MSEETPTSAEPSRSELAEFETAGGHPEPSGQPEPAAPSTEAPAPREAAPTVAVPAAPEPSPTPTAPAAPERRFKIRGQEYTASELLARPDLIEAMSTTAEQFPHLQGKYQQLLERLAKGPEAPTKPETPAPQPTAAAYEAVYGPMVKDLVGKGLIEEDVAAAYPNFVNQGMALAAQIGQLSEGYNAIRTFLLNLGQTQTRNSVETTLNQMTDSLAFSGDELYKPLADAGERGKFYEFLTKRVNPPVEMLSPEFIASQWFAYKQKELAETIKQVRASTQAATEVKRTQATGQAPGARAPRGAEPSALERELREFEANL